MTLKVSQPILGFENILEYNFSKIDDFFYSIENNNISFTLIDPSMLTDDYLTKYNNHDTKVYNIVTILNPIEESTINFLAPILINEKDKTISQIILDEKKYPNLSLKKPIKDFINT